MASQVVWEKINQEYQLSKSLGKIYRKSRQTCCKRTNKFLQITHNKTTIRRKSKYKREPCSRMFTGN